MTIELLLVAFSLIVSTGAIVFVAWDRRDWLAARTRRRAVVHTTDDRSLEGILLEHDKTGLVLTDARYLEDRPVPLVGDIWIPRTHVRFVQVLAEGSAI